MDRPPIVLDKHRGMAAQAATELRRIEAEVEADQAALRERRDALESVLSAGPAAGWSEAVEKARYLLSLFAETPASADPNACSPRSGKAENRVVSARAGRRRMRPISAGRKGYCNGTG
jgi:hypothetical protein